MIDVVKVGEYTLFAIDEIKIGKEGRKMPGVKLTHQSSDNNSKFEFIMGHTIMCIALVVKGKLGNVVAMPILGKILGGIKNSPNDKITFVEKTILEIKNLLSQVKSGFEKTIFVAACHRYLVWKNFKGWLRTINRNLSPSIEVTSNALGNSYIDFISGKRISKKLKKFIFRKMKKIFHKDLLAVHFYSWLRPYFPKKYRLLRISN